MSGSQPKVLYYDMLQFQPENLQLLSDNFEPITLPNPGSDSPQVLSEIEVAFAPLGYIMGREKIDLMPNLKAIASNTSTESHIDIEYARSRGIAVITLVGQTEFLDSVTPTSEHTWGLLLGLMRRIPWAFERVLQGEWDRRPFGAKAMLSSMSLGIVGLGRLGKMVAVQAKAFRMSVSYYDPSETPSPIEGVAECGSIEELVSTSDVVSLHIPLTPENEGLFSRRILDRFKHGAYLVNTSRGEIVDTEALLERLESGQIAGAALDVFPGEFVPGFADTFNDHPMLEYARTHDNLLITPHISGSTIDAWRMTEEHTIKLVLDHLRTGSSR